MAVDRNLDQEVLNTYFGSRSEIQQWLIMVVHALNPHSFSHSYSHDFWTQACNREDRQHYNWELAHQKGQALNDFRARGVPHAWNKK